MKYLLTIVLVLSSLAVNACGCISFGTVTIESSLKATNAVFVGKVISKTIVSIAIDSNDDPSERFEYDKVIFGVTALYKGKIKTDTISVYTTTNYRAGCGYEFKIGSEYIVYSNYEDHFYNSGPKVKRFLITNTCTRTRLATDSEEIKEIEKHLRNKRKKS